MNWAPLPRSNVALVAMPSATVESNVCVPPLTFTAAAAVDFVRNSGAVDGLSAVSAGSSNSRAKGKLVATARSGSNPGQIPNKFLADVPASQSFAVPLAVTDNATSGSVDLGSTPLGKFSVEVVRWAMAGVPDGR